MSSSTHVPDENQRFVEFNCLGAIFLIRESSLNRFPDTLLGDPKRRALLYNESKRQHIIDRHIPSFEAIVNYYEAGRLVAPPICEPIIFFEELKYFQFDETTIEHFYRTNIHDQFISHRRIVPSNKILRPIWIALEY